MTLAERGIVENLAESFQQQRLDDSNNYGHLCNAVSLTSTPSVQYRSSSCVFSMIYGREKQHKHFNVKRNILSKSCLQSKALSNKKIHESFKEGLDVAHKPSFPEIHFEIKQRNRGGKDRSREILSSSEEELSELCSRNGKFLPSNQGAHLMDSSRWPLRLEPPDKVRPTGTESQQSTESNRKRYKQPRKKTTKKIKLSRPSLDLDKMLATRLMQNGSSICLKNGNIFAPIDATWILHRHISSKRTDV